MTIITLPPIADISQGINYQYPADGGAHYAKILSQDDAASYIGNKWSVGWQYDYFRLPIFASGIINSVSIVVRGIVGTASSLFQAYLFNRKTGGIVGGTQRNSLSYTTYTETFNTNPLTGLAWTLDDLASMQLVLGCCNASGSWTSFITQAYVSLDVTPYGTTSEVLTPNGAGSFTGISSQYPASGSHFDKVDEDLNYPDEDDAYISTVATSDQVDTYALSDISSDSILHIAAVIVLHRSRGTNTMGSGAYSRSAIYTNGALAYGAQRNISVDGIYDNYIDVWTVNPNTGLAWTKAEVQALQAGVAMHARSGGWTIACTKVAVIACWWVDAAPNTPSTPSGISNGAPATSYEYSTSATDPEGDQVQFTFDWGDESQSSTGFVASGQSASASHSWVIPGTYSVKAYATDALGAPSGWSSILTVVIAAPGSYARVVGLW